MKVKSVTVNKLFGIFTHKIALNVDDHITIIHGPNGFGKTAILRLLDGVFNSRHSELRSISFKSLVIDFTNGTKLEVARTATKMPRPTAQSFTLTYKLKEKGRKTPRTFKLAPVDTQRLHFPIHAIEEYVGDIERVSPEHWRVISTDDLLTLDDVLERYSEVLPFEVRVKDQPAWLRQIRDSTDVHLVQTQRLLTLSKIGPRSRGYERKTAMALAVTEFSDELVKSIQNRLSEYAALSQALDRSFPARLVKGGAPTGLTKVELREKLATLEERRSYLMAAGLLDSKQGADFQLPGEIQDRTKDVLSVYVRDVDQKLSVFDEIANRIDLFKEIINSRFIYKRMAVTRDKGFTFTTASGEPLSPSKLSSGEQHELVLFYALIFKVKPNSLILIDEPEISLHVAWQEQFLRDLERITRLSPFDILIATHSPQIIHDRWDLTVELKGIS